jgi:hypothetical protein
VAIHFQEVDDQAAVDDDAGQGEEGGEEYYEDEEGEGGYEEGEGGYEEGGIIYEDDGADAGMPSLAEDPVEYADVGEQQEGEYGSQEVQGGE